MKRKAEHRILFDSSGCLTQQAIALFVDGKLSDADLSKLKKHASGCDLCTDALEGAIHFKSGNSYSARIEQMHNTKWRRSQDSRSKSRRLFYGISSAAASIVLLFGIYFILRMDRLVKEDLDLQTKSELVLSEPEELMLPDTKQSLPTQSPENEIGKSKKQKIEKQIKEDIKTIEEPAEIINEIAFESDVEVLADDYNLAEEEIEIAEFEAVEEEELMHVEYKVQASPVADREPVDVAITAFAKEELPAEEKAAANDRKKALSRKSRADKSSASKAYYIAEVTPMFQGGGVDNFNRYLADSLKIIIPDSVLVESIIISFVVDTSGYVDKVKLVSGTSSDELNDSIVEFVKSSPVWIPGYAAGKVVETEQQMEIVLDTNNNRIQ